MFLKMPIESLFSRAYMLFNTGNPNLRSIFKAEVVIMVLLRMRNNKVDTVNPNLKSILLPDKVCSRADAKVFFFKIRMPNVRSVLKPGVVMLTFLLILQI